MAALEYNKYSHAARVVELLLEYGSEVNPVYDVRMENSLIQLAARFPTEEALRLLLAKGVDPNKISPRVWMEDGSKCPAGRSAIQVATEQNSLIKVQMLLQHDANPDLLCPATSHTALQRACQNGNKAIADLLIEYGANVNAPPAERYGATALQFAAIGGYLGIAHTLVQKGASINAPPVPHEGRTALEGAAEHGRIDMLQFLKNSGADISGPDFDRALDRSLRNGHLATRKSPISYL